MDRPSWPLIKPGVNPNLYTIGIEHEGRDNSPYPWPPAQMTASIGLVREIAARWGIPLNRDHVITHRMIRRSKTCPGSNFDHADYVQRLGGMVAELRVAAWNGGVVRAASVANVRPRPGTGGPPIGRLMASEVFPATQLVADGEPVRGNPRWFGDGAGRFLWAGATDRPDG